MDSSLPAEPSGQPDADPARLRMRRAPKYRAFVLSGIVIGVLAALVAVALAPDTGDGRGGSVLGYLAVSLGALGALLGGAAALLLEGRARRR
jgi:hypothetical protein